MRTPMRMISLPLAFALGVLVYRELEMGSFGKYFSQPHQTSKIRKLNHRAKSIVADAVADAFNAKQSEDYANEPETESPEILVKHAASAESHQQYARVQGKMVAHGMMDQGEVDVEVQQKLELAPVGNGEPPGTLSEDDEDAEYVDDIVWPDLNELDIPLEFAKSHADFYGKGRNRARQLKHGRELPAKRTPDLIITGAKKCGTSALKIFMNFHPSFQDERGEKHFFNRPTNFKNGYDWYTSQMPFVYKDEVCYEKTPDYFDRPFVPERMSHLNNSDTVKFIHVLCDPVRRSFSHFLHMFVTQNPDNPKFDSKPHLAQAGFDFLEGNFGELKREDAFGQTIRLALKSLLGGKDIDTVTDDEIRTSVNDYFSRWDLKMGDPRRVFPLRVPDSMLTGSIYSVHIRTYLHYFRQNQMLYLDASELIDNPGKSLRRVAQFMGVPPVINENNFYYDEEKGYFCMTPPVETGRASFCLGSNKGRSKDKELPDKLKEQLRRFFRPFHEDLTKKYTGETYDHWDW